MGKTKLPAPTLPPPHEDPMTMERGKCSLCGCGICSATALYCIACYRKCLKRCPECTSMKGVVTWKYQRHTGMGRHETSEANGEKVPKICPRCACHHTDDRQLKCETCGGDRVIFELPQEEKKDAAG